MHPPPPRYLRRLWLFAGTGDGPPLASRLRAQGWRLRVSVVTAAAARAYGFDPDLEVQVGRLGGADRLTRELVAARRRGEPFTAVVDATHPFASRIQDELEHGSATAGVPLLRLQRSQVAPPAGGVRELADLAALEELPLAGTRLLLAIGSRHLGLAVRCSPGALHHARVLPTPAAVAQALAAGLAPERLAPLHPRPGAGRAAGAVEAALLRRWRIEAILARASGPPSETLWRRLAADQGCRLLLLRRPARAGTGVSLGLEPLLRRLATWGP